MDEMVGIILDYFVYLNLYSCGYFMFRVHYTLDAMKLFLIDLMYRHIKSLAKYATNSVFCPFCLMHNLTVVNNKVGICIISQSFIYNELFIYGVAPWVAG